MSDIQFQQVERVFTRAGAATAVLRDIDLHVRDREFVAVVGPSGCGKTTLLRLAAGLDAPTSGQVRVGGKNVEGPGPDRAVVFQQFALFPWKTVAENIAFGLRCKGTPEAERQERVRHFVQLMGLQGREDAYPHQLSGGMQQRVAIARAYALEPDVLLMDEPFGALDAQTRTVMQEELLRLCAIAPRTVMFITHAVEEAVYLADRVVVMSRNGGEIVADIDVAKIRQAEGWAAHERIEDVMDLPSFVEIRGRVWKMLREQDFQTIASEMA
ncbi:MULTISPECIES: ABC transporter ATP-binding protein [unclassified Variovorax]|uniref:ABC transporter ATP-binding protein n=1 Tax=unclassified Variovorax TaxID=663243 RepID=UPI00076CFA7E|nr:MULTISPECIES: ABC transporter ATP-binding protein [unclassified Variovorax]KWT74895.1 ABC-type nitrate/sulfonate/bicarbonate transport system, ATPase component [Variovorax sp. WDL1]PNG47425.1 Bicarbonate transport ATP-binding protein CmpC [Variovorax sp. B2]PNG47924.1 Bicarbonate transport ATP-binding protein CmpC [Variovorax sp. B4]VTV15337.1 Bicarbonate transport ATP-binding protein CmpC [Variovorax sp. WDL1]